MSLAIATPAAAQDGAVAASADFARFTPKADATKTSLDYAVWDDALRYMVFRMVI